MRGDVSKYIFVESSCNTDGRDHSKIMVPPHPFTATGQDRVALTLQSFSMRRNWPNINDTNRFFYLSIPDVNNVQVYYEIAIPTGVYTTFAELVVGINEGLLAQVPNIVQIAGATVVFTARTREFRFDITMAAAYQATPVEIRCFASKGGVLPANVSIDGGFSDVHEILGASPIRNIAEAANSFLGGPNGAGVNVLTSRYPASLSSLSEIYLHANLETGNFMSTGHQSNAAESLRLIESSIFARVPFERSSFSETFETIQYEDTGGDAFQSYLTRKTLETLDLRVTDARGRSLAKHNPQMAADGLLSFRLCLRYDLFHGPDKSAPLQTSYKFEHPPRV